MEKASRHLFLALLSVCFSAGMSLFVKLASSASISLLVFVRFGLGIPIFLWVVRRYKVDLKWRDVPKNLFRSISGIIALYSSYYAVQALPLVNAVTLTNTAPLFLPILFLIWDHLLVSKRRFFAIGLGFLGVCIIMRPTTSEFMVLGSIFGLVAGFFRAVSMFNVRLLAKTEKTTTILSYYFFIGAVLSFFPLFFDWKPVVDPLEWLYILAAGILALGFQYTFTKASAHIAATKISSMNYLAVILGGLLGWWVFGEVPDIWVWIGAFFIILGAIIAIFDQTPPLRLKR